MVRAGGWMACFVAIATLTGCPDGTDQVAKNEAEAIHDMRFIATAEIAYQLSAVEEFGGVAAYGTLTALGSGEVPFIDAELASGVRNGYSFFTIPSVGAGRAAYTAIGMPMQLGVTGERAFYVDESGIIRFTEDGSTPTSASPPL